LQLPALFVASSDTAELYHGAWPFDRKEHSCIASCNAALLQPEVLRVVSGLVHVSLCAGQWRQLGVGHWADGVIPMHQLATLHTCKGVVGLAWWDVVQPCAVRWSVCAMGMTELGWQSKL
jgi:hypothetical protein